MKRPAPFSVLLAAALLATAIAPSLASAASSFVLDVEPGDMQDNFNVPRMTLANTSTAGEEIVSFSVTIGDAEHHFFDFVADGASSPIGELEHVQTELFTGATLLVGDRINDRSGVSILDWRFDDFQPGEALVFQADIDPFVHISGRYQSIDGRYALLDNGDAPNALVTVHFSDGSVAGAGFEDSDGVMPESFRLVASGRLPTRPVVTAPVPEPGAALLFGAGLVTTAGLGASRRRG